MVVDRMKAIIASVLPILWLATLVHWPADEAPVFPKTGISAWKQVPARLMATSVLNGDASHDDYARCQSRRVAGLRGQWHPGGHGPADLTTSISFKTSVLPAQLADQTICLSCRWQFICGAAGFPRAPSLLV